MSGDSNQLQKMRSGDNSQPHISIYITDSRILEPKQQAPAQEPAEEQPPRPMRVQKLI